jgi:hypothetical protein
MHPFPQTIRGQGPGRGLRADRLLEAWTAANLEHIRRHKPPVAGHRGPLDRHCIARIVRRVARAAGVPGVHPHRLRHTLATQGHQPRHAARGHRRAARPPENGNDADLRHSRQPGRRRRIPRRQRQDRCLLRAAARTARRPRDRRHGPPAPRGPRPHARQRPVHPPAELGCRMEPACETCTYFRTGT